MNPVPLSVSLVQFGALPLSSRPFYWFLFGQGLFESARATICDGRTWNKTYPFHTVPFAKIYIFIYSFELEGEFGSII